ncbi:MAG TPA: M56 family metallopeptidase, partial [Terriglobales bacterium]|nr:M56 family metallopeptidase [Terriglobales bacterium]
MKRKNEAGMTGHTLTVLAQTFAEQLPACLLGGTAVVIFAWILLRITGRRNPGTRFAVWLCALFAVAALLVAGRYEPGASASIAAGVLPTHGAIELPSAWAFYVFVAWATIAGMALVRVGVGLWHVGGLRQRCDELDIERLGPSFRDSLKGVRSRRRFSLCVSESVGVPTAIGFFRPAVVIPRWLVQELSPADLRQVVLHEVAHLERWDDWTNLAQKVLRALLFFHPAAWWIEKRLTLEREMACDDVVLRQTANPRAYAQCLALLA